MGSQVLWVPVWFGQKETEWEEIEDRVFVFPISMLLIHLGQHVSLDRRSLFSTYQLYETVSLSGF